MFSLSSAECYKRTVSLNTFVHSVLCLCTGDFSIFCVQFLPNLEFASLVRLSDLAGEWIQIGFEVVAETQNCEC